MSRIPSSSAKLQALAEAYGMSTPRMSGLWPSGGFVDTFLVDGRPERRAVEITDGARRPEVRDGEMLVETVDGTVYIVKTSVPDSDLPGCSCCDRPWFTDLLNIPKDK